MLDLEAAGTGKVLVMGHRGALGHAPENTMASFQKGLDLGSDLIELDVHMSRDGALVVMHDGDVSRTTDGSGHLKDLSLEEIKRLDAGSWFDARFGGERVPTLSEVLEWAGARVPLIVEIKGDPRPADGIEKAVVDELRKHRFLDRAMVISFHHDTVRRAKDLEPSLATGILYTGRLADTIGAARAARADSVRPSWSYWSADLVNEVHKAGMSGSTWVANDEELAAYLIGMGIDSIGCDYPDRLRSYVDRTGKGWKKK